jgi:hypothetical protein
VKKGHSKNFSSELIHILLLKIQKVSNILGNSLEPVDLVEKSAEDLGAK